MAEPFPLSAVLRLRELAAEREEQALARIHAELAALRAALEQTEADLREAAMLRERAFAAAALPAMHLQGLYNASDALRSRRDAFREQIAAAGQRRDAQIARYRETYRQRETLIALRNKAEAAHEQTRAKREAKAADEAFLNKMVREARSGGAK